MFKWEDILIIGDSFAAERLKDCSWPKRLTKLLINDETENRPPRGKGFGGSAWWSVRGNLIEELKITVPKVLILCHTEATRLHSEYDFPLNSKSVGNLERHIKNNRYFAGKATSFHIQRIQKAAVLYYKYLFNMDYHLWAQRRWFEELDGITKDYDIPYVIHLHCFNHGDTYIFKNGLTVEETLWENSEGGKAYQRNPESMFDRSLINHFTIEENLKLANALYNTIDTYSIGKRKIGF